MSFMDGILPEAQTKQLQAYFVSAMLVIFACNSLGKRVAENTGQFVVIESPEPQLILRRYGDEFIAAAYDRKTNSIRAEYRLVNVSEIGAPMQGEQIGNVVVKDGRPRLVK